MRAVRAVCVIRSRLHVCALHLGVVRAAWSHIVLLPQGLRQSECEGCG